MKIFKNENGFDYAILEQKGSQAILINLTSGTFAIVNYLGKNSWIGGDYYQDLTEAVKVWNRRTKDVS